MSSTITEKDLLCHNCLLGTHDTQSCGKISVCLVKGCGQKHTMYLHINETSNPQVSTATSDCCSCKVSYMPIVKVVINDQESAYC